MAEVGERLQEYLAWLDARAHQEPTFTVYKETPSGIPVTVMTYADLPDAGSMLAFTFGVSEPRADGATGAELVLCVRSTDPTWSNALGVLGETVQGALVDIGETFNAGEPLVDGTSMSAFVFSPPLVRTEESIEVLHLSDGHLLVRHAIPIYEVERLSLIRASDRDAATRELLAAIEDTWADPAREPIVL